MFMYSFSIVKVSFSLLHTVIKSSEIKYAIHDFRILTLITDHNTDVIIYSEKLKVSDSSENALKAYKGIQL